MIQTNRNMIINHINRQYLYDCKGEKSVFNYIKLGFFFFFCPIAGHQSLSFNPAIEVTTAV